MEKKMNTSSFNISMNWARPFSPCETDEERTLGDMTITANEECLTRNVSKIIDSLRDKIRVSSFPLAVWFVAYWWRLLYEPTPSGEQIDVSYSWKNSHELPAANSGYVWPAISFIPDGKFVTVIASPQYDTRKEALFYLGHKEEQVIENSIFVNALKYFITSTLRRLEEKSSTTSELHTIWEQLNNEMNDEDFSLYRRIEAILGYDPDEAPERVIGKLEVLLKQSNESILTEISSLCSINETKEPDREIEAISRMSKSGLKGKWIPPFPDIEVESGLPPWTAGRLLAKKVRVALGNLDNEISTKTLCDFLGITDKKAMEARPSHDNFNLSYVKDNDFYINFMEESTKYYGIGRRFQLARIVGSLLSTQKDNYWFISSSCKTYYQRLQRAFAAEFLAPIDAITKFVAQQVTNESIAKAASHFSVSPQTIAHSLANQRVITKSSLLNLYF